MSSVSARLLETCRCSTFQPRSDTTALGARRRRFQARDDDTEVKSEVNDMDYNSFPLRLTTYSKPRFFNEGYLQNEAMLNLILTPKNAKRLNTSSIKKHKYSIVRITIRTIYAIFFFFFRMTFHLMNLSGQNVLLGIGREGGLLDDSQPF